MLKRCIIIEDQPPAQRILKKYIEDIGSLELKAIFNNALDAIPYLQDNSIDLVFLDIHLPKISGIDFLKTLNNSPQIILTTAFSDYALESYEFNVVDYLLKPFSFQRFIQAITKAAAFTNETITAKNLQEEHFYIKSGHDLIKVMQKDIIYIHSDADYTEIITANKKLLSTDTLKIWLQKLDSSFIQIHKSYIVNTDKIEKVSSHQIVLENTETLPVGRVYRAVLKSHFKS